MCKFCRYRGVYSEGMDWFGWVATTRSLPDFIASRHLRFAALLTAWTNAGWRNASKLWRSIIWWRELIQILGRRGYTLEVESNFPAFYTPSPTWMPSYLRHPESKSAWKMWTTIWWVILIGWGRRGHVPRSSWLVVKSRSVDPLGPLPYEVVWQILQWLSHGDVA